ncbi:helix-turn-helix domain-containing protein [Arsenicicoccus dermatophilus]|uniref:helix-turn-helix domain-containing protein n=1 Tax=Arsenicicoccus dermatophilus TaxID=1076331 RepID=UPI001F4C52E8|nr:winged helix-turn-helix domain-containing protein [Arsenicicoccus dermatophilus]MCH8614384.1 winged helix-turn-helix domain-containing protein [Arsenicicoccus dermatophilus]
MSPAHRRAQILDALRTGPPTTADLVAATGIPRSPIQRRLTELRDAGQITRDDQTGAEEAVRLADTPQLLTTEYGGCGCMSRMTTDPKPKRDKVCMVRLTTDEWARLNDEARAEGISLQALGERRLLGYKNAQGRRRPNGAVSRRKKQEEELPLTG